MTNNADPVVFGDLARMDSVEVTGRTGCEYDRESDCYRVPCWGNEYKVCPGGESVVPLGDSLLPPGEYLSLLLLYYLMKSGSDRPLGQWISEKDVPGGAAFFRGPHAIPVHWITRRFDTDLSAFEAVCRDLGGTPVDAGDAAFGFEILPRIPVAVVYWLGDEDFPCEAALLFDKTLEHHLPLDIIFAMAVLVCRVVGKK